MPSSMVWSLGVILDAFLSVETQIMTVARSAIFHGWSGYWLPMSPPVTWQQCSMQLPDLIVAICFTQVYSWVWTRSFIWCKMQCASWLQLLCRKTFNWLLVEYWIRFKVMVLILKALRVLGPSSVGPPLPIWRALYSPEQHWLVAACPKDILIIFLPWSQNRTCMMALFCHTFGQGAGCLDNQEDLGGQWG